MFIKCETGERKWTVMWSPFLFVFVHMPISSFHAVSHLTNAPGFLNSWWRKRLFCSPTSMLYKNAALYKCHSKDCLHMGSCYHAAQFAEIPSHISVMVPSYSAAAHSLHSLTVILFYYRDHKYSTYTDFQNNFYHCCGEHIKLIYKIQKKSIRRFTL